MPVCRPSPKSELVRREWSPKAILTLFGLLYCILILLLQEAILSYSYGAVHGSDARASNTALPFASCVTLGKLLNLFVPHIPQEVVVMNNKLIYVKPLEQILVHSEHIYALIYIIITQFVCARNTNTVYINSKKGFKR